MKICIQCGHTEIYPEEFDSVANAGTCPMCGASSDFIKDFEETEEDDDGELWKS